MALAIFAKVVSQPRRVLQSLQVLDQAASMSLMTLILASTRPCCWWALGVATVTLNWAVAVRVCTSRSWKLASCNFSSCVPQSTNS